jgi:hypothetical protein
MLPVLAKVSNCPWHEPYFSPQNHMIFGVIESISFKNSIAKEME